jgi:hypothetical protein
MPTQLTDPVVITAATNRCFQNLVTAQAALAGYLRAHEAGGLISQVCFTEPREIELYGDALLDTITQLRWPTELRIGFHGGSANPTRYPNPDGIQRLMGSLYEHAFVTYFETVRPEIEARFGAIPAWPETIDFGRVVRNAFAHGGTVEIRQGTREGSVWRGVRYTRAENGRVILYNDLAHGDVTLLMLDIDEYLR